MNSAPVEIAAWLGCLAFLLGIGVAIKSLLPKGKETREITPQPLHIKNVGECVTEQICKERMTNIERELLDLKQGRKDSDAAASGHRKVVYDKIDDLRDDMTKEIKGVSVSLAEMTGVLRSTTASMISIQAQLQSLQNNSQPKSHS